MVKHALVAREGRVKTSLARLSGLSGQRGPQPATAGLTQLSAGARGGAVRPVSYTHLTLPTILLV